jgi:16S rRNA (cytosine967-C5)-methyltransferase
LQLAIYLAVVSRYHSYLNSAMQILKQYNGEEPFASFLKKYFSANKKFGSKDRKHVSNLCYCFFRMGKAVMNTSVEEKILTALFLSSDNPNEILAALKPEWNDKCKLPLSEKLLIINYSLLIQNVFPWKDELSEGIDHEKFCESFPVQPDLFLRLRPGKEKIVKQKLLRSAIEFKEVSDSCLALSNASKIDDIIELDSEAVVQDLNSQQTGKFIKSAIEDMQSEIRVWDCCAGSGGKSIMMYDIDPNIDLTVSDLRESILANLKKRFEKAGIIKYNSFISDLATKSPSRYLSGPNSKFQLILCDVPCTGSGTWSRTPEQLYFFDEAKIETYSRLQKKIISNIIPQLQPGSIFIYITCSVFKKENEENVEFIKENFHLQVKQMPARMTRSDGEILKGYDKKADSMFVAVVQK